MKYTLTIFIIALTFFSCNNDDPLIIGDFRVRIAGSEVVLSNLTDREVFYFAKDQDLVAIWAAGVGEDHPKVKSGETIKIPFSEVLGYDDKSSAIEVYYWNAISEGGTVKAGRIQTIVFNL